MGRTNPLNVQLHTGEHQDRTVRQSGGPCVKPRPGCSVVFLSPSRKIPDYYFRLGHDFTIYYWWHHPSID